MIPTPDCGEQTYKGHGRLVGKAAVVTGGDSGIGRAVAIAYAREGADVLISYLSEDEDAADTAALVEAAGRKAVLVKGDISQAQHCRDIISAAVAEFGKVDILVSNAAYQMTRASLEEISDEEWDYTIRTNLSAMFHLCKAALPHMGPGSSIIGSSSVNSDNPSPALAPYAATKAAMPEGIMPCWGEHVCVDALRRASRRRRYGPAASVRTTTIRPRLAPTCRLHRDTSRHWSPTRWVRPSTNEAAWMVIPLARRT